MTITRSPEEIAAVSVAAVERALADIGDVRSEPTSKQTPSVPDLLEALDNVTAALRNVLPLTVMSPADREARRMMLREAEHALARARGEV